MIIKIISKILITGSRFFIFTIGGLFVRSFYKWLTKNTLPHPDSDEFNNELTDVKKRYSKLINHRRRYAKPIKKSNWFLSWISNIPY